MEAGKQIRGKDLVGGVMVMPMGLGDAIKKRTSGEFKMEQKGSSMSFSQTQASASGQSQSSSMSSSSRQLGTFQEETNESFGSQMQKSSFKTSSSMQSSAMSSSHESSSMTMSSSKSMSSSSSSKTVSSSFQESHSQLNKMELSQSQENQEIKQDKLKTQIVSAITDLEGDRDLVDFSKENRTIDLMSPAQAKSPTPKSTFTPTKQDPFSPAKQDLFSPPPLEQVFEQPKPEPEPELKMSNGASHAEPLAMAPPARNGLQNGFNEFVSTKSMEMQQIQEFTQSTTSTSRVNGAYEETGTLQESGGSNPMLQKIMTPASMEYDTGSLKKKDPKKMFTDSSFYNSKYHPTIADQVEMAHKLSSAMFNEQNKGTKGAKMYLTRMENSGGFGDDTPKHDNVPNMKLVMNPEGKVHVWDDLPPEQRPDMGQLATHAAPNLSLPDVADPVAESLQAGVGRGGELFNKRKQKADSWVVDESTIGRINPGAVADKFIQEQSQQQLATQQQKMFEQQQRQQIQHEQMAAKEADQLQQQREAQQAFMQQQQFKQEQSMEVRRIQEMAQQQIDFPQDFQHTSLKARSYTPSLDLGCHNVQGINVWANTAPRGWGSSRTGGTPTRGAVATPGPAQAGLSGAAEGEMMARMEETRLREEEERRLMQEERLRMEEEQRMEAVRIQQQQEEQMRLKQEREEQMQREQAEMMRQEEERRRLEQEKIQLEEERRRLEEERFRQEELRRQEEEMRRQQEEMKRQEAEQLRLEQIRQQEQEQRQRLEQEEMFRQAEMKRQEEERQRQQQIQLQQQQEQMIIQQQREQQQQQQLQMQQQQQREQQQQIQMQQQQQMEQQQQMQMQQQQQQQYAQQQQMQMQQQHHQTTSMTTQEQKISSITKAGGFSYGAIPTKEPKSQPQQAALPPMSSSSTSFESSQSQQFSSVQQSSSSFSAQQQSQSEIYESQEFNGGVMKGYRRKDEASTNGSSNGARDSGIFTGINGDANSLVDETFDYKKHTVKDLAAHFALVKPKQNIPSNILPEQKIFNGGQAPQLNYLGANEAGATVTAQHTGRRELSQQDIEASKQAYEMKKKKQMEAQQSQTTTTTTDSSSVVRRTTETSSEQKSERRMSLRDSLMLDPAQAHADAGLIDPSAILRGSDITGRKSTTEGMNQSSVEGETDKVMNKWDNHNTIARGWAGMGKNYQPVTFRSIYNIGNKQESSFQL